MRDCSKQKNDAVVELGKELGRKIQDFVSQGQIVSTDLPLRPDRRDTQLNYDDDII